MNYLTPIYSTFCSACYYYFVVHFWLRMMKLDIEKIWDILVRWEFLVDFFTIVPFFFPRTFTRSWTLEYMDRWGFPVYNFYPAWPILEVWTENGTIALSEEGRRAMWLSLGFLRIVKAKISYDLAVVQIRLKMHIGGAEKIYQSARQIVTRNKFILSEFHNII